MLPHMRNLTRSASRIVWHIHISTGVDDYSPIIWCIAFWLLMNGYRWISGFLASIRPFLIPATPSKNSFSMIPIENQGGYCSLISSSYCPNCLTVTEVNAHGFASPFPFISYSLFSKHNAKSIGENKNVTTISPNSS